MNNSEIKRLIKSKGFVVGEKYGSPCILTGDGKYIMMSQANIEWLQSLNDIAKPQDVFHGVQKDDRVQLFTPIENYAYWTKFAIVKQVSTAKTEWGKIALVEEEETGEQLVISVNNMDVIHRPGQVDLRNMSPEERDRIVLQMSQGAAHAIAFVLALIPFANMLA